MKYYMGDAFDVNTCKEYKTEDGGRKAAEKAKLVLFDESGNVIYDFCEKKEEVTETDIQTQENGKVDNSTDKTAEGENGADTDDTGASEGTASQEDDTAATMTNNVPDGATDTAEDGSVKTFDEDGNEAGTASAEEVKKAEESVTETIEGIPAVKVAGRIRRVFDGNIRIRNRPSWDVSAVRGVSRFDEKKVTHVMEVDDKPMYRTSDGYFISGEARLVEYIEE